MNVKELLTDDRAVSPVVGVALLIAITVILAAVIGGVVLGLGTSSADAPQASLSFENSTGTLSVNHDGGEALVASEVVVRVDDPNSSVTGFSFGNDTAASESTQVADGIDGDETVNLVWQDPNSDDEQVLATYEA
jgi:flagellin-like protein